MRTPFWITALLAALLALGAPLPGLAAPEAEPVTLADDGEVVPGVPVPKALPAPPPSTAPDLAEALRSYRVGQRWYRIGAILFGTGAAGIAGGVALSFRSYELSLVGLVLAYAGLLGVLTGGVFMPVGATLEVRALRTVDLPVPWAPVALAWGALGLSAVGLYGAALLLPYAPGTAVALIAGAFLASAVLASVQAFLDARARREYLPRVAIAPAPVGRAPGLALVARF